MVCERTVDSVGAPVYCVGMAWLSTRDVAAALAVTEHTVRHYAREGVIPFIETPGGHRRYELAAVVDALATRPRHLEPAVDEARVDRSDRPRPLQIAPGWRSRLAVTGYRREDDARALEVGEETPPYASGSAAYVVRDRRIPA